jgi:diketogulonate reductase-like aldo/keto reductase
VKSSNRSDCVLKRKTTVQGKRKLVDYPEVKEVAERLGATTAQVLIAWGVSRGYSVIPKSVQKGKSPIMTCQRAFGVLLTPVLIDKQTASSRTLSRSR